MYYPDYTFYESAGIEVKTQSFGGFFELEYDISENISIGGHIRYSKTPDDGSFFSAGDDYISENEIDSTLQTTSTITQKNENQNHSLYLDHRLDTTGSKLSGEVSYNNYKNSQDENSMAENTEVGESYDLSSVDDQRVELYYSALDVDLKRDFADCFRVTIRRYYFILFN